MINDATYDTDFDKIFFVLSHMTEKTKLWKELFLDTHVDETTGLGEEKFPTFNDFIGKLEEDFKAEEHDEEALDKLYLLKQGNRTAEELVTEFKFLAREAGLGFQTYSDHIHMIRLFQEALNPWLVRRIFHSSSSWGEIPKTIDEWFMRAIQLEKIQAIIGKGPRTQKTNTENRSWNCSKPTAKNANTMSQQERTDLMKKGACFRCKKPGHRVRDCPPEENTSERKWTPKDIHAIIRAMTKEEQAELLSLQMADGTVKEYLEGGLNRRRFITIPRRS